MNKDNEDYVRRKINRAKSSHYEIPLLGKLSFYGTITAMSVMSLAFSVYIVSQKEQAKRK